MADLIKPVLKNLFLKYKDNLGTTVLEEPIYLQITKFRTDGDKTKFRFSDKERSIAAMVNVNLDKSFCEVMRIVKLKKFRLGYTDGPINLSRLYIQVEDWEDAFPSSEVIGSPLGLYPSDIFGDENAQQDSKPKIDLPAKNSKHQNLTPVESISPYVNKWTLLARASKKSDVREFTRQQSDEKGRLFSCTFTDETGDIKATAFTEAVDKFYKEIIEGQQYYLEGFEVKKANPKFNNTSHEYELIFTKDTKIEPSYDTNVSLPSVFFKFVPSIAELANIPVNSTVDVAGVASQIHDVQSITSKSSSIPYTKRDIMLVDDSSTEITLTIWGADAEGFDSPVGSVVAVKGARLSDFRGLSLSATRNSQIVVDPDDKFVHKLKGWWKAVNGTSHEFHAVATEVESTVDRKKNPRYTINKVFNDRIGQESVEFFEVKARVATVYSRNVAYPSCTNGDCRKKVTSVGPSWYCEKCEHTMDEPKYRYLLTLVISDVSSPNLGLQLSVFDEVGQTLYGDRAYEFQQILSNGSEGFNGPLATELRCIQGDEYIWGIKASAESYQGTERVRFNATYAKKPDPISEGTNMLAELGF